MRFSNIYAKLSMIAKQSWEGKDHLGSIDFRREGFVSDTEEGVGIVPETLRLWALPGANPTKKKIDQVCRVLQDRTTHFQNLRITAHDLSDEVSVSTFREKFLPPHQFGKMEDAEMLNWIKNKGVNAHFQIGDLESAERAFLKYRKYTKIIRSPIGGTGEHQELSLFVRSVIPLGKSRNGRGFIVSAELTFPGKEEISELYKYRGYFTPKHRLVTWVFVQDGEIDPDIMVFMTDKGSTSSDDPLVGHSLTMSEGPQFQSVAHRIEIYPS